MSKKESFDPKTIIVYGGGGHGKSVIDMLLSLDEYKVVGIVDDGMMKGENIFDIPVLGGGEVLPKIHQDGIHLAVNAVGGIGNVDSRVKVFERLKEHGFTFPTIVHPRAHIEPSAKLANGVQVLPMAYVGSDSKVGFGTVINYGAIISHDCILGEYVNISPGAMLAGEVIIGKKTQIGMGATINLSLEIGENSLVGNGATVKKDVPSGETVRAGTIWPIRNS